MEKNIHNDPLDDYVRNRFDDYEENPAADMWSRIESDLAPDAPAVPVWRVFYFRNRLRMAAAFILLLLSGLVCEHYYYENKLRDLTLKTLDRQNEPADRNAVFSKKAPREAAQQPNETAFVEKTKRATSGQAARKNANGVQLSGIPTPVPSHHSAHPAPPAQASYPTPVSLPARTSHPATDFSEKTDLIGTTTNMAANSSPDGGQKTAVADEPLPALGKSGVLDPLGATSIVPLPTTTPQPVFAAIFERPIEPVREPSGWYVGLHTTSNRAFENTREPVRRPGGRPVFVGRQERPQVSVDWWLKVGKTLNRRIGLESGIGYTQNTRTTAHTARFRFDDGVIQPGGPILGQRRDFSYDLSTYGGSAAVSLRMEPADDSTPVTDTEPVIAKITATERTQLLRIPLLLTGRVGSGRMQAVAKAGLTGNFFLKNDLEITAGISQNSRLRFAQNANNIQFERTGNFFLGYWVSAGLEFRWNRQVRLVAEPVLFGNFARRDAQDRRLPDQILAGVNVGVNWVF